MSKISLNSFQAQQAMLQHQRRVSSISSVVIALLVLALLMILLAFVLLPSLVREEPVLVSYNMPVSLEEKITEKTVSMQRSKPSAPSSVTSKVIAANTSSPTAIPVPEIQVTEPSIEFGTGDDFGDGWGNGSGDGMGGGGTTFFQQKVSAQRICYVIDYSASMGGERDKLMRQELTKSIGQIGGSVDYQMIFFAGPAWVAGSEVKMLQGKKAAEVKMGGGTYKWKTLGGAHKWEQDGKKQRPEWMKGDANNRTKSLDLIQETKLVWGTDWEDPLMMALEMDPPPQVIFFMTDGSTGGDMVKLAQELGKKAHNKSIINTVAMMQPKAEKALKELARQTGGQFTIVEPGGKSKIVPLDD